MSPSTSGSICLTVVSLGARIEVQVERLGPWQLDVGRIDRARLMLESIEAVGHDGVGGEGRRDPGRARHARLAPPTLFVTVDCCAGVVGLAVLREKPPKFVEVGDVHRAGLKAHVQGIDVVIDPRPHQAGDRHNRRAVEREHALLRKPQRQRRRWRPPIAATRACNSRASST